MVNIPVSLLTGMAYRATRWERVNAPRDDGGGHTPAATDLARCPGEDTGQTSTDHGAGPARPEAG
jgi:hypothetical protein